MADTEIHHEKSGLGGVYFVLGAIVVALGVVLWFMMAPADHDAVPGDAGGSSTSVTIDNTDTAPANTDSAPATDSGAAAGGAASTDGAAQTGTAN